jgi:hypothetical protein
MQSILRTLLIFMLVLSPCSAPARIIETEEYCTTLGGCGYRTSCASACITPAVGFALVILAAMIATGLQNRGGHAHQHCH